MVYLIGYKCPWDKYPTMRFLDGDPFELEWLEDIGPITTPLISLRQKSVAGYPIKSINVPTTLQWLSRHEIPDFEGPPGFICVSSRFKDVVERFEPDVHQFFPVAVVNKAKEKIAERWLWVVCNRIDGVDREHTNLLFQNERLWTASYKVEGQWKKVRNPKVVFNKSQTQGYHFWRDKYLMGGGIYASDEAAEDLLALDLAAFAASKLETV